MLRPRINENARMPPSDEWSALSDSDVRNQVDPTSNPYLMKFSTCIQERGVKKASAKDKPIGGEGWVVLLSKGPGRRGKGRVRKFFGWESRSCCATDKTHDQPDVRHDCDDGEEVKKTSVALWGGRIGRQQRRPRYFVHQARCRGILSVLHDRGRCVLGDCRQRLGSLVLQRRRRQGRPRSTGVAASSMTTSVGGLHGGSISSAR